METGQQLTTLDAATCKLERIARSPDEEWRARAARDGAPEPISDDFAAAWLMDQRPVTVRADGIRFTLDKTQAHFFEPDTLTIRDANLGQIVQARYDRDDLSCIHILDAAGRYVETIGRYIAPGTLDAEASGKLLAVKKREIKRLAAELQELHGADTRAAAEREVTNAERISRVRTFPLPPPATTTNDLDGLPATTRDQTHLPASDRLHSQPNRTSRESDPVVLDPSPTEHGLRFSAPAAPARPLFEDAAAQIGAAARGARGRAQRARGQHATAAADYADAMEDLAVSVTELETTDQETDESW